MIVTIGVEVLFHKMVEQTSREESVDCLALWDEETLWPALQEGTPDVIFLELGISTLDVADLIEKLKRNPSTLKIPLVVFGNSLRADLLQDAQEAGADLVLPKSAFHQQLPELIRHYKKAAKK